MFLRNNSVRKLNCFEKRVVSPGKCEILTLLRLILNFEQQKEVDTFTVLRWKLPVLALIVSGKKLVEKVVPDVCKGKRDGKYCNSNHITS